jgi:TctA family transporter
VNETGNDFLQDFYLALYPHAHWMLWCAMIFILQMGDAPAMGLAVRRWPRVLESFRAWAIRLGIFCLAGGLGFVVGLCPMLEAEQTIFAFVPTLSGLLVIPWLVGRMCGAGRSPGSVSAGVTLLALAGLVWWLTGLMGMAMLVLCSTVGALPLVFGSSRLSLFAFWFLPLAVEWSGWDVVLSRWVLGAM